MLHERHSSFGPEPLLTPFCREKIHRTGVGFFFKLKSRTNGAAGSVIASSAEEYRAT